ncbi:hypothetical protein [Zooshikella harenae]|uniref:Uncharacterized protein n=1 Tax=Zooshikella harenae TaxID=2827238 RepID=A0ABS5ZF65_9GAMM|nr:hypothetical protein [Zooshikella harenae]MBU2712615.1 hypothetical protein [Zooshikella harenae]
MDIHKIHSTLKAELLLDKDIHNIIPSPISYRFKNPLYSQVDEIKQAIFDDINKINRTLERVEKLPLIIDIPHPTGHSIEVIVIIAEHVKNLYQSEGWLITTLIKKSTDDFIPHVIQYTLNN